MTTYFSPRALESQRSSGYRNTTYALAELIDNSFDAEATEARVIFIEKRNPDGKKYIDEILIADNGSGMSDDVLKTCLQFGGTTNDDMDVVVSKKKIGKFGFGLPNASLSQSPKIQVFSWQSKDSVASTVLDLEQIKKQETIEIPDLIRDPLPHYFHSVDGVINEDHGTVVSWKDCDRLSNSKAETIIRKSEELVGRIFRYLLAEGEKTIILERYDYSERSNSYVSQEKVVVRPNDPLFLMENTVFSKVLHLAANSPNGQEDRFDPASYYKKFSISEKECLATNDLLKDQSLPYKFSWKGREYRFDINVSVAKLDIQKPGIKEGAKTKVGAFYKGDNNRIFFVRAGRELSSGNFGFYNATDPQQRWWSLEVSFDASADDLLGVHNNKQGVEFEYTDSPDPTELFDKHTATLQQAREELWFQLTNRIEKARKEAWKRVKAADKTWRDNNKPTEGVEGGGIAPTGLPGGTSGTTGTSVNVDGTRKSQFTEEDKKDLEDRLVEKYPSVPLDDIKRTIELYDKALLRGCVLYTSWDGEQLWTITNVGDFLIVLINTNHSFYEHMIAPLMDQGRESARTAIELFISSLAWEEHTHFNEEKRAKLLERFRSYVGIHMNQYFEEFQLDDELDLDDDED